MRNYLIKNSLNFNSGGIIVTKRIGGQKVTLHVSDNKDEANKLFKQLFR